MRTMTFLFFVAASSVAQQGVQGIDFSKELPIVKMEDAVKSHSNVNEQVCGDYFVLNTGGHSDGINSGPAVYFFVDISHDNKKSTAVLLFLKSKYFVKIDRGKQTPTVQQTYVDGVMTKIVIRISRSDYEKSKPCLPPPA